MNRPDRRPADQVDAAADAYQNAHPGSSDAELAAMMLSDALVRLPTTWFADAHAGGGGRTWMYDTMWESPLLGAAHGIDVPLVFGTGATRYAARFLGTPPPADFSPLSDRIRDAWTTFAATGDPGWPRYDIERRQTPHHATPTTPSPNPGESGTRPGHNERASFTEAPAPPEDRAELMSSRRPHPTRTFRTPPPRRRKRRARPGRQRGSRVLFRDVRWPVGETRPLSFVLPRDVRPGDSRSDAARPHRTRTTGPDEKHHPASRPSTDPGTYSNVS